MVVGSGSNGPRPSLTFQLESLPRTRLFLTPNTPTSFYAINRFLKRCQEVGFGVIIPCSECLVGNAVLKYISRKSFPK